MVGTPPSTPPQNIHVSTPQAPVPVDFIPGSDGMGVGGYIVERQNIQNQLLANQHRLPRIHHPAHNHSTWQFHERHSVPMGAYMADISNQVSDVMENMINRVEDREYLHLLRDMDHAIANRS